MTDFLLRVTATVVAISGLTAAIGIIAKSSALGRPLRWLWKQNVAQPVGDWGEDVVRRVVDDRIEHLMHHPNAGSSLLDLSRSVGTVKAQVSVLLQHDAERDIEGKRYQHPDVAADLATVQQDVVTLLDHDAERDVDGKRYGEEK